MRITKRTLIYLDSDTEIWAEPADHGTTYLDGLAREYKAAPENKALRHEWARFNGLRYRSFWGALSRQEFPKSLLECQLTLMLKKIDRSYWKTCLIGQKDYVDNVRFLDRQMA